MILLVGPLALFSDLNPGESMNNVESSRISLSFEGFTGDYEVVSISSLLSTDTISESEFTELGNQGFLRTNDERSNIQNIVYVPFSDQEWIITDPGLAAFISALQNTDVPVMIRFEYEFTRPGPVGFETVSDFTTAELDPEVFCYCDQFDIPYIFVESTCIGYNSF